MLDQFLCKYNIVCISIGLHIPAHLRDLLRRTGQFQTCRGTHRNESFLFRQLPPVSLSHGEKTTLASTMIVDNQRHRLSRIRVATGKINKPFSLIAVNDLYLMNKGIIRYRTGQAVAVWASCPRTCKLIDKFISLLRQGLVRIVVRSLRDPDSPDFLIIGENAAAERILSKLVSVL